VTQQVASTLSDAGLVCYALWTDFDNDGWIDLALTGEWMPITFLKNTNGRFTDVTSASGISSEKGWWNSMAGGDFDNDGDIDYIAGNLGENSFYHASTAFPVNIYAKDFDNNQSLDAITTVYLKDENSELKEFTAQNRDDIVRQLPGIKKRFLTYKEFGKADIKKMFPEPDLKDGLHLSATNFKSSFIKNMGNGKFEMYPLPDQAQLAPVYGILIDDYNNDGNLDLALTGNDHGTEVITGRYDAFNGLVCLGDGRGNFKALTILESGFYVPGDAKALVKLSGINGSYMLAASQNKGPVKVFKSKQPSDLVRLSKGDTYAILHYRNGQKRKEEFYYGTSFLSQSARFLRLTGIIQKV
jgi:enediyne biosynthesis protein E4